MGLKPNRCDNPVYLQNFEVTNPLNFGGSFSLECGSDPFVIFESDLPTEMFMTINQTEQSFDMEFCELRVTVEVENGPNLVFLIQGPNVISGFDFENNGISFYSKNVTRITLECLEGTGRGCRGNWNSQIFFRNSRKSFEICPISYVAGVGENFSLECGAQTKIFESDEATEIAMVISLNSINGIELCNLTVNVELENGSFTFTIPSPEIIDPSVTNSNTIFFTSRNVRRITLECEGGEGTGCLGFYDQRLILRETEV